jgi:Helicase associated domain
MNRLGLLAICIPLLVYNALALLDPRLSRFSQQIGFPTGTSSSRRRTTTACLSIPYFRPGEGSRQRRRRADHHVDDYYYKRRRRNSCYSTAFSCIEDSERETATSTEEEELNRGNKELVLANRLQQRGWHYRMQQMQSFYQEFGHSRVTSKTGHSYPGLYQWVRTIRGPRKSTLSSLQVDELQRVGICWNTRELAWQTQYTRLQKFYGEYGHCRVPNNSKEYIGLGVWVRNQRREHRLWLAGGKCTLSDERRQLLETIDFQWHRPHELVWQERYDQLCQFVQQYGHANVPQTDPHLGVWCMNQRTSYRKYQRGEPSAMTKDRVEKLQAVGFLFLVRRKRWETMVTRLSEYHTRHGHVNIATNDTVNRDLRLWLITQRFRYNQKLLSNDRILSVEDAIPDFEWYARNKSGPSQRDWSKLFDAMRDKGISPDMPAKQHWFQGAPITATQVKDSWTPDELLALWNEEDDEDDETPYHA